MTAKAHWNAVYESKPPEQVSWYQREARVSLGLIRGVAPQASAAIIDVGGGASVLVDGLLAAGYRHVTVLDVAAAALEQARARLGEAAAIVNWRVDDILAAELPAGAFDVWHDRAVFHFLTNAGDRARYVAQVRRAVRPGGHVIVATFADDGPSKCSGLEVSRYSAAGLHGEFGEGFRLVANEREGHVTPRGASQAFVYCVCRHEPPGEGGGGF